MQHLHLEHQVLRTLYPDIDAQVVRPGAIRQRHGNMPLAASAIGIGHLGTQIDLPPAAPVRQKDTHIFQVVRLQRKYQIMCRHRLHIHPQPDHRTGMPERQHRRHRPERPLLRLLQRHLASLIQQVATAGHMIRQATAGMGQIQCRTADPDQQAGQQPVPDPDSCHPATLLHALPPVRTETPATTQVLVTLCNKEADLSPL